MGFSRITAVVADDSCANKHRGWILLAAKIIGAAHELSLLPYRLRRRRTWRRAASWRQWFCVGYLRLKISFWYHRHQHQRLVSARSAHGLLRFQGRCIRKLAAVSHHRHLRRLHNLLHIFTRHHPPHRPRPTRRRCTLRVLLCGIVAAGFFRSAVADAADELTHPFVIPAKAGISLQSGTEIPAFAGMTMC